MKLSILIATLPNRAHLLNQMVGYIGPLPEGVEIITDARERHIPTGTKRNDLIQRAGDWFCFVDDDDYVTPEYLSSIVEALNQNPDCVTFNGWYEEYATHGAKMNYRMDWTIKLGEAYEARNGHIYRWPNHLAVMRKSLIQHVKFPDVWQGEDYQWSLAIRNAGLLKTEVHIDKQLYRYIYIHSK